MNPFHTLNKKTNELIAPVRSKSLCAAVIIYSNKQPLKLVSQQPGCHTPLFPLKFRFISFFIRVHIIPYTNPDQVHVIAMFSVSIRPVLPWSQASTTAIRKQC
jgi:hypothetical protein